MIVTLEDVKRQRHQQRRVRRTLNSLRDQGFDQSYMTDDGWCRIQCSQCQACSIQGVACHETGCPNVPKEEYEEF